jgi:hypothetical protein
LCVLSVGPRPCECHYRPQGLFFTLSLQQWGQAGDEEFQPEKQEDSIRPGRWQQQLNKTRAHTQAAKRKTNKRRRRKKRQTEIESERCNNDEEQELRDGQQRQS